MRQLEKNKQNRPVLDEQKLKRIAGIISEASRAETDVKITVFGELGIVELIGRVSEINPQQQIIKLILDSGSVSIRLVDIVDAATLV